MELQKEIGKRLTFAIISHPDAGKTTITEKLLLFGKAIHIAGAVKSNRTERKTTSDFMEMEKQRGISVSTSVMGFEWGGRKINLLDTPGHADFSEDTYRTLTAVDSTLMVIDSVKGVEERTKKLCEICRMRKTPIITYINKLDREGKDPIELMDEVETELNVKITPMSWPVGQGKNFKGVYSLYEKKLILFNPHSMQEGDDLIEIDDLNGKLLDIHVGRDAAKLREEIALIREVYPPFDRELYLQGETSPVFFGSAINNFGVRELLDCLIDIAPAPSTYKAEERIVEAGEDKFSGFIFKIHANLNPKHRDRIAFLRICSGRFEKNKSYLHVRSEKTFKTANPTAFMAQERNIIDFAYPGDIIGLHDTGQLKIGDAITEGEKIHFTGIPSFAPQIFRTVINRDPMKSKQFEKGLQQLAEEGVVQLFIKKYTNERLLGVVGMLQLEVVKYRLEYEYKALCSFESSPFTTGCWIRGKEKKSLDKFVSTHVAKMAEDVRGAPVFLARNKWLLERTLEESPKIEYYFTSDFI